MLTRIRLYATARKDLKSPLIFTFVIFLVVCICYCVITPSMSKAQIGFNVLSGIGQSGPLTLLVALVQFTSPHAFLSTATGLAFSARAIGGAFGSAVLDAIINGYIKSHYASSVGAAAVSAGVPNKQVATLVDGLAAGNATSLAEFSPKVLGQVVAASEHVYAAAYHRAWTSIIPYVVLALVCVIRLKGVRELMTEKVEASVERDVRATGKQEI